MADHNVRLGGMKPVDEAIYARRRANAVLFIGLIIGGLLLAVGQHELSMLGILGGFIWAVVIIYRLYVAVVYSGG